MKLPTVRKYPKILHITPEIDYRLKFVRRLKHGEQDLDGECDPAEHVIRIKLGMSPEETFKTFIHEVLHALSDERNIGLNESKVRKLEDALAAFILMNF